jgi:hypothetical protein
VNFSPAHNVQRSPTSSRFVSSVVQDPRSTNEDLNHVVYHFTSTSLCPGACVARCRVRAGSPMRRKQWDRQARHLGIHVMATAT